jgi:hypothetical protein
VSHAGPTDALSATQALVVLLRLTVGIGGRVLYGEVVDPETHQGRPFRGLAGLLAALREWLAATVAPQKSAQDEESYHGDRPRNRDADRVANAELEDPCLPS